MAALGSDRPEAQRVLGGDLRMLATDVSASVLKTARDGRYSKATLATVPSALRAAWVQGSGDTLTIDPMLRDAHRLPTAEPARASGRSRVASTRSSAGT